MVCIFIFHCVTVQAENTSLSNTVCNDGRDIVETADKGMKVFDTGLNSTFCECSPLWILPSSFKRFFHCGSRVLGVVQSTNVLCWSEKSHAGFPPSLSKVPGDEKLKKTAYAWSYFTHCATRACTFNSCPIARDICLVNMSKTPLTQTWKITVEQMRILFIFFPLSINYRTIHYIK